MPEPEPDTEPDIDYVDGFVIMSCVPEDPKPQSSIIKTRLYEINESVDSSNLEPEALQHLREQVIDELQEITVCTGQSNPNWQEICEMVSRAKHRQPTVLLRTTAGCIRPAATTDDLIDSPSELQVTLGGRCKECAFFTKDWSTGHSANTTPSKRRQQIWGPYVD